MFKNNFSIAFSQWWKEVTGYFYPEVKTVGVSTAVGFTSALFLVISYLMLTCSRFQLRDAAAFVLYSLIGDLCHLAGAFLSNQTFIQRIMALIMTTLDVVHFISVTWRLCWSYHSTTGRRARMLSRRKRQNFFMVCLLFGMGGYVYADVHVRYAQGVASGSPTSRKLLNVIHDKTELLGYVLGLVSFAISWTCRIPILMNANKGEMSNSTHVSSRGCSALAGALYASAILLYDPRLEFVVKALPWILSGACCAVLDVFIVLLSCYRICYKRQSIGTLDSDTESLLGRFHKVASGLYHTPKEKTARKHSSSRKCSSSKMPELGSYRNTNVQPIRKVCLKEVTITQEDSAESQPLKGSVKVVRVDECYSSGSVTDSSCLSSELEWDFEETPPPWSSHNGDRQKTDVFPLQEWTVAQRSKSNMRSSSSACFCNRADLEEKMASESPDTNFQSLSDSAK
ncbi:transmembrane protein 44 [Neoarius graeffei]|uniref:transmembrane protein 44 n=1 Tax=Neoarius graeffei TaxID=443677 RepID=UPI00298C0A80|nr:transmembrane protein 44 [Neoarius graeffei]